MDAANGIRMSMKSSRFSPMLALHYLTAAAVPIY